jgi:hypothetical protein
VQAAPIGEESLTFCKFENFVDFFKCLQHHYIGANWSASQKYYCNTKRIKILAGPRPFG